MPSAKGDHCDPGDIFAAFGEALIIVDDSRHICQSSANAEVMLGVEGGALDNLAWTGFLQDYVATDTSAGLYWAVEAVFEKYISTEFLPTEFPFKHGLSASLARLDEKRLAIRLRESVADSQERFFNGDLRPSLTSAFGFTDVILKGIDGPMTDIQIEDLSIIHRDTQFALELVQDYRARFIQPVLVPPVPVALDDLLALGEDDLPLGRIASQKLTITVAGGNDIYAYSNGGLRIALIYLLRVLVSCVVPQSEIAITADVNEAIVMVQVAYQPADSSMQATKRVEPIDLFNRREIKGGNRLHAVVSSLHAQLCAFGCTAWADPNQSGDFSLITMTVPRWSGPVSNE